MVPFFPAIWNVLHDGGIDRIVGSVPGDVRVFVGIEYLRERFSEEGDEFVVRLTECTTFYFSLYDSEETITDLESIANESMSILSAEMNDSICRLFTDTGVLEIQCADGSVALDSGREIPLDELFSTAEEYWKQWDLKPKRG